MFSVYPLVVSRFVIVVVWIESDDELTSVLKHCRNLKSIAFPYDDYDEALTSAKFAELLDNNVQVDTLLWALGSIRVCLERVYAMMSRSLEDVFSTLSTLSIHLRSESALDRVVTGCMNLTNLELTIPSCYSPHSIVRNESYITNLVPYLENVTSCHVSRSIRARTSVTW